jgi:hypothetical protein
MCHWLTDVAHYPNASEWVNHFSVPFSGSNCAIASDHWFARFSAFALSLGRSKKLTTACFVFTAF